MDMALDIATKLQKADRGKIESGIHTDTIVFRDQGKSFKIDWSEAAKRDQQGEYENVRGLAKWAYRKPVEAQYRIAILEHFERASNVAPHALLKLIEEPPPSVIFLFTTQNHHQLLDTILSRMTVVRLPRSEEDFEILDEVRDFFEGKNLIAKFRFIEQLDRQARDNKDRKIDRTIHFEFLEDLIRHARFFEEHRQHLGLLFETHQAISQNLNPRFSLERLAMKVTR